MSDQVITSIDQVTPEWLTSVLGREGALTGGAVTGFETEKGKGNRSTNALVRVKYAEGSQGTMPRRLFLKMVHAHSGGETFNSSEVTYYTRDYLDVPDAPLVRCYDAAFSEQLLCYHLLLDDLSETHFDAAAKAPTLEYGLALAEGLAALHARWWGARRFTRTGATMDSAGQIRRFVALGEAGVEHFLKRFDADLEPHWRDAIYALYANHPQALIARTRQDNGFTLIHGDVAHYNVLVPREGDRPIYIIDRQPFDWCLTTWLGVYDLIYAMVLNWDSETRRRLELPVLRQYHAELIKHGVDRYAWEQLYDDYRLCVAMGVYITTEYCRSGVDETWAWYLLLMLQRSLTACDDLACAALW